MDAFRNENKHRMPGFSYIVQKLREHRGTRARRRDFQAKGFTFHSCSIFQRSSKKGKLRGGSFDLRNGNQTQQTDISKKGAFTQNLGTDQFFKELVIT